MTSHDIIDDIIDDIIHYITDGITNDITIDEDKKYKGVLIKYAENNFISTLKSTGVKTFIIHARKAMLGKFTPKQNLNIPPLKYDFVYKLKKDNPDLNIIINGGIKNLEESLEHLGHVDGVMIGRAAYDNPFMLSEFDEHIYGQETKRISKAEIFDEYVSYMTSKESQGYDLSRMVKHLFGLSKGDPHAKAFRKLVLEAIRLKDITPYKSDLRQLLVN